MVTTDTIIFAGNIPTTGPLPQTYTTGGVTLNVGAPNQQWTGVYPSLSFQHSNFTTPIAFYGSVTFQRTGPTMSIVNNNACDSIGDTITVVAVAPPCVSGATITITGPAGSVSGASPLSFKFHAETPHAGLYKAYYEVPGEKSLESEITVTVAPKPARPTITGKVHYCTGEPFQPLVVTGQNISWYTDSVGGTGTTVTPYVNTNMPGAYTWYASQTVNNCEGKRTGVTITVAPIPPRPGVVSPVSYCEFDPATPLTANGQNLKWYVNPVGGLGSVVAPVPGTTSQDTLTWYVSQTVDQCESPRAKLDVIVTFKPNGHIVVSDTPWICRGEQLSFQYYGSGTATTGYNWTTPGDGKSTIINNAGGPGPFTVRFDSAGLQTITLVANNLDCYSDVYRQYVTVKELPSAIINAPMDVCLGDDRLIGLHEFTPTTDTFYWNWNGGVTTHFATDQGPYGVYWNTPGRKVIVLDMVDELCHGLAYDTIEVRPLPDASVKATIHSFDLRSELRTDSLIDMSKPICSGDSLKFEPNTLNTSSKYQWSPERFFDDYANLPVSYGRIDFTSNVMLKVTDEFGCVNEDTFGIKTEPCCTLNFPTAFSPNNDGRNDVFRLITNGFYDISGFRVMNRWGQTVYESVNDQVGWDGTHRGEPQDLGVYYYYIRFKCDGRTHEQRGEFVLVR